MSGEKRAAGDEQAEEREHKRHQSLSPHDPDQAVAIGDTEGNDSGRQTPTIPESGAGDGGNSTGADGTPVAVDQADTFTAFYQVHNRLVGLIIGKGGESVKQLKEATGATVRLTRDADQDPRLETREMCITGSLAQLNISLGTIKERLDQAHMKKVMGPADGENGGQCPPDQMIITVPNHCVGLLIGKGGSTIKEMNESSGCHIQIAKDVAAVGFPREVTLSGLPSQILDAQNEINRRLATVQEKLGGYMNLNKPFQVQMNAAGYGNRYQHREIFNADPIANAPPGVSVHNQSGDGRVVNVTIPNNKTGLLIGKGAQTLRQMQEQSGALITIPKDADITVGTTHRDITISGEPQAVQNAVNMVQNKLLQSDKPGGSQPDVPPGAHSTAFKVPNDKVGLLIGKGGATFKEMQMQTGARIFIPKEPGPDGQREITISGDPVCITNAYYLIHGKIASSNNPGSGAYTSAQAAAAAYSAYASSYNAYSSYFQNYQQQGQQARGATPAYGQPQAGQAANANQYQSYAQAQYGAQANPLAAQGYAQAQGYAGQQSQATQGLPTPTGGAANAFGGGQVQQPNYGVNQATQGYGGAAGGSAGYGHY